MALAALVAALGGAGASALETSGSAGRDAVWRAIFKRDDLPHTPPANPTSPEKVTLGHDLFRDTRLSGSVDRACASCHQPERAFTDGRARGKALDGSDLARNVPQLYNLAWSQHFFWDGRATSLEEQARGPLTAPNEMAGDLSTVAARLKADPAMVARFQAAFPATPDFAESAILEALAAYERSLVAPVTRFDRWVDGDDRALSGAEMAGFRLFAGKAGCVACHGGWRFTDDAFHDIGLRSTDPGRGALPSGVPGLAEFKTPSLRELARTAPYMHDGSLRTLRDVVDHYAGGLVKRPSLAQNVVRDLELVEDEKQALVAFLLTLSSEPDAVHKNEANRTGESRQ